jgi:hypothetical protein
MRAESSSSERTSSNGVCHLTKDHSFGFLHAWAWPPTPERRCPMTQARILTLLLVAVALALLIADGPVGPI